MENKAYHDYKEIIDAALACAAVCNHCAASCLQEDNVQMMARCIQLDMECAALCYASVQLLSLGSAQGTMIASVCADACDACADECEKHEHKHCQECAALCRRCAELCRGIRG